MKHGCSDGNCYETESSLGDRGISVALARRVVNLPNLMECQPDSEAPPLNRSICELGADFVWIEAGEYILGSDRQERDIAYQISAVAAAQHPNEIAKAKKNLQRQGWFDGESNRTMRSLPAVCIGKNLITNAEYQTFVYERLLMG